VRICVTGHAKIGMDSGGVSCDLSRLSEEKRMRDQSGQALEIKICGLKTSAVVTAAIEAGADMIGFVFFPASPRDVSPSLAAALAAPVRGRAKIVALVVDPSDTHLAAIAAALRPDLLQLHGSETPERAADIRARFGIPVMKVLKVAVAADLAPIGAFRPHVDRFLFDAKPPPVLANALPGGNGLSFDWQLVAGLDAGRPSMLSGGLTPDNVAEALRLTGLRGVDVSSGVEQAPGEKDPQLIKAFVAAARSAL
jgi:phosphoribosylanthranilate isomerase